MSDIISCSLPDTQTQREEVWSQQLFQIWGWLYPVRIKFKTVDLCKPEFTLGKKGNCDYVINATNLNPNTLMIISKFQFKIFREVNELCSTVYLQDFSYNGTFINKIKVGKGKKMIINNDDEIAIGHPDLKIFILKLRSDISDVPLEISSKYAVSKLLGTGAMGEVKLVINKRNYKKYAMKKILKNKIINDNKIWNEPNILKKLEHPCIIHMEDIIDTKKALYIILELMEGGELFDRITCNTKLTEFQTKLFFYQIIQAVHYLHKEGITHRDLKPENMLLASNEPITLLKINDFGLSKIHHQSYLKTVCGTPMYVAPEVLLNAGKETYTKKIDIWSLGVILYFSLSGIFPFCQNNPDISLHDQIINGIYSFDKFLFHGVSATAIDLIKQMLIIDPEKRVSVEEVLEHKWMKDENIIKIVIKLMNFQDTKSFLEVDNWNIEESDCNLKIGEWNVELETESFTVPPKRVKID